MFDFFDYLFPVRIIRQNEVLVIEDGRPTLGLVVSAVVILLILGFSIYLGGSLLAAAAEMFWLVIVFGLAFSGYFVYRILTLTFREIYVFDKAKDTYIFTRQSVINKDVLEGSLSQFQAVQVERRVVRDEDSQREIYHVALLQDHALPFGSGDAHILRENPPLFNSFEAENRIASAISDFLKVSSNELVDI